MYPHHVFDLEPAGTFGMYPICYWWVSGGYIQPEPAIYSRCFHWFPGPLAPSVARSEDAVRCMEAVGRGDLAAVVARNLLMTRSLRVVDALLLVLCVWEIQNFEWWEHLVAAEEVPVQDLGECHRYDFLGMFLERT